MVCGRTRGWIAPVLASEGLTLAPPIPYFLLTMIAPRDATSRTMLRALGHSLGSLDAAIDLDVDRTDEERAFFSTEKAALQPIFDDVFAADQALTKHLLLVSEAHQARVELGNAVLDRGVRASKTRMRLELKNTSMPAGVDEVFPSDISEIVDAERRVEPGRKRAKGPAEA